MYFPSLDKEYTFSENRFHEMFESAMKDKPNKDALLMLQHFKDGHEDHAGLVHLLNVSSEGLWGENDV
ncbi:hypothetical protein ACIQZG_20940 [Lysinibacillus sp. NPDC096418]|uniref:hypothetical protein n=1 Tax=Lysinibacillus sp. NPDC096418 TaxID=3364138 RepID=UPI00382471A3